MATNRLMAEREISSRERLQKTVAAVLVYAVGAGALWYINGGWPRQLSPVVIAALAASIVWVAYIVKFATATRETASSKEGIRLVRMRIADDRAGKTWVSRIGLNAKLLLLKLVFVAGLAIAAGGLYILGKQVYTFATRKIWVPVAILEYVRPYVDWLFTKDIWIDGQRAVILALNWLSAGFVFTFLGAAIALAGLSNMDKVKDKAIRQRPRAGHFDNQ